MLKSNVLVELHSEISKSKTVDALEVYSKYERLYEENKEKIKGRALGEWGKEPLIGKAIDHVMDHGLQDRLDVARKVIKGLSGEGIGPGYLGTDMMVCLALLGRVEGLKGWGQVGTMAEALQGDIIAPRLTEIRLAEC